MILEQAALAAVVLFPLSEVLLAISKRAGGDKATAKDRGSLAGLWIAISVAISISISCRYYRPAHMALPATARLAATIALIAGGLAFRWWAIRTLGRFFTVDVAAHSDHRLVDRGPYRLVRHPSYTGLLIAFMGLGVYFSNWLSFAVLMISITAAFLLRIRVEEGVLSETLGADYKEYCARTKRLIPFIF